MDIGLQQAVEHGMETYITSRRASIPVFIDRHFSFRGALALHRKTFGRDFYRFCRKVRFLGKIQKFGIRNSMT
jgi:hypothetical protein